MTTNRNWVSWIALALAGLALLVALGGRERPGWAMRGEMGGWKDRHGMMAPAALGAQVAPAPPAAPGMVEGRGPGGMHFQGYGPHGGPHFFKPFFFPFGLIQLLAVGLLGWLLYRLFTQRRGQNPGATGQPAENRPHDPRVE